jgi:structural maintenance of chromosome 2
MSHPTTFFFTVCHISLTSLLVCSRLDKIDRVLAEEITPTLEKLRLEKGNYITYTANETKMERAERFMVAHHYHAATKKLEAEDNVLNGMKMEVDACMEKAQELKSSIEEKSGAMEELRQKKGGAMSKS